MMLLRRRLLLPALAFLGLSLVVPALSPTRGVHGFLQADEVERPDILLVTIDTLRADRVGAYGYRNVDTRNLDKLASQGLLFENAVTQVPLTPPSHASMFTGLYPTVHLVRDTGGFVLSESHVTLAEVLREQGWTTAAFVGSVVLSRAFGLDQGFETYDDKIHRRDEGLVSFDFPYRRGEEVVDRALAWLEGRPAGKPYFLWVHLYDPHTPYNPPQPFKQRFAHPYDGEVSYADAQLGRVFEAVKQASAGRPLIQVVLSDHGEALAEHGEFSHGVFLYESTLRIPWIMAGPGIPGGVRIGQQARTIDLLPTLLDMLGIAVPEPCQGVSLTPVFSNPRSLTGSTYSYAETLFPKINMGWAELRAMRTNKWKYIRAPRPELYDLENDPGETINVIEKNPVLARRLDDRITGVASLGSPDEPERITGTTLDPETLERLRSLGYVSIGTPRSLELRGEGVDPKDRVQILSLLEEASSVQRDVPLSRRISLLEEARRQDPTNTTVLYILGEAYERGNRDEDALEVYQKAVSDGVTTTNKIYVRMAAVLGRKGRMEESIAAFEKAIQIDPTDTETQNRLAIVHLMRRQFGDAERLLKGVLVLDDTNAKAHNSLGWLALEKNDTTSALVHFQKAIDSDPSFPETYLNLGFLYKRTGQPDKARSSLREFLQKAGGQEDYQESVARARAELATLP